MTECMHLGVRHHLCYFRLMLTIVVKASVFAESLLAPKGSKHVMHEACLLLRATLHKNHAKGNRHRPSRWFGTGYECARSAYTADPVYKRVCLSTKPHSHASPHPSICPCEYVCACMSICVCILNAYMHTPLWHAMHLKCRC